ncbi:MAG: MarR family transcriptional regulator [Clostridiales bacterium]|nr:MarR family transcriptional regulator [Clostridiales bacterium]
MQSRYEQFASSIASIYHSIQKIEKNVMVEYGSKGIFAQYLAALYRRPEGLTAAKLSEMCDKDKAAVSRTVAEMEREGLILREDNRYRVRLVLTEEGRKAAEYVSRQALMAVKAGGHGLSDEERAELQNQLALIADNLEKISRGEMEL